MARRAAATAFLTSLLATLALSGVEVSRLYGGNASGPFLVTARHLYAAFPPPLPPPRRLPPITVVPRGDGYDGQFSLLLALHLAEIRDWPDGRDLRDLSGLNELSDLNDLSKGLDLPRYRIQRIGMPLLAAILSAGRPVAVPWAYLIANCLLVAAGTAAVAYLAVEGGHNPAWSALVVLSCGTVLSLWRGTVDAALCGLLLVAMVAACRGRRVACTLALGAAILTKETALLALPALVLSAAPQRGHRPRDLALLAASAFPAAIWWGVSALWLPADPASAGAAAANLSWPGVGFWPGASASLLQAKPLLHRLKDAALLGTHLLAIAAGFSCGAAVWRRPGASAARQPASIPEAAAVASAAGSCVAPALAAAAFAGMGLLCSRLIWIEPWSYARVLLPLILLLLVAALARPRDEGRPAAGLLLPPILAALAGTAMAAHLLFDKVA